MKFSIGKWGVGVEAGRLVILLYLGDVYLKIPLVGELAVNSSGFFTDRYHVQK